MKEDYEVFKKFLQNEIDSGFHKTFLFNEDNDVIDEFKNGNVLSYVENMEQEIERLNNIINELEHDFESYELEYLQETYQGSLADFIETELDRIKELKGSDKE